MAWRRLVGRIGSPLHHGHLLDGQHRRGAAALAGVPLAVTIDVLDDAVVEGVV
jgi:hypothetical protein